MKPKLYKIKPVFGAESIGKEEQIVIDFLLDVYGAFRAIARIEGIYKSESASCEKVILGICETLDNITAKPCHHSFRVKVDVMKILQNVVNELALFSLASQQSALRIIKSRLSSYRK